MPKRFLYNSDAPTDDDVDIKRGRYGIMQNVWEEMMMVVAVEGDHKIYIFIIMYKKCVLMGIWPLRRNYIYTHHDHHES